MYLRGWMGASRGTRDSGVMPLRIPAGGIYAVEKVEGPSSCWIDTASMTGVPGDVGTYWWPHPQRVANFVPFRLNEAGNSLREIAEGVMYLRAWMGASRGMREEGEMVLRVPVGDILRVVDWEADVARGDGWTSRRHSEWKQQRIGRRLH